MQPAAAKSDAPRLMHHTALEGLLRGLALAPGSPEYREVARLCGGSEHPPQEIPVERYISVLEHLARTRFAGLTRPEALFRVGAALFDGYQHTLLGKIQLAALQLAGPERIIRKAPDIVSRNSNFGVRTLEQRGPRHYAMHFRGVPVPADYYRGVFTAALHAAGAPQAVVSCRQTGEEAEFEARW